MPKPPDEFTLYLANKTYSSWSLRGWLAARLAGVAFEEVVIPLGRTNTAAGILRRSPSGRLPALRHGAVRVWDSLAIGEYLAEVRPKEGLWPRDAGARAVARSICAEMHSGFAALRQELPMNMRRAPGPVDQSDPARDDIARIVDIWNFCRAEFGGGGEYLFGSLCLADAAFAPVVSRFTSYEVLLDAVSQEYCEVVWRWPAMQDWLEAAQHEPWVNPEYER